MNWVLTASSVLCCPYLLGDKKISVFVEAMFYRTIVDKINDRVGRYYFFFSAGIWSASHFVGETLNQSWCLWCDNHFWRISFGRISGSKCAATRRSSKGFDANSISFRYPKSTQYSHRFTLPRRTKARHLLYWVLDLLPIVFMVSHSRFTTT